MANKIEKIELDFLTIDDYQELKQAMIIAYQAIPDPYWEEHQIKALLTKFPEGQIAIKAYGHIAGCALSIIIDHEQFEELHTYKRVTGNYTFNTHLQTGDTLYGIDVFIKPEFRGLRLGRRLYDYRKELCEKLNLKGIEFGGRIPNYHTYESELSPKQYIEKVKSREISDPVLDFQLSNDFYPVRVLKGYLEGDKASSEYAVLLKWDNIYYEKPSKRAKDIKKIVRLGLVQWQMRPYKDINEVMQQAEFFVDTLSAYHSDFALFPEFFNAPLMADYNKLIVEEFSKLSIAYNINIITGSMPEVVNDTLYNVGYLCKRNGSVERYEKLHITPDEQRAWGMKGGNSLQ